MVISFTIVTSNLSPYVLKWSRRYVALLSDRTLPRTEKPCSKRSCTTQAAMKPFAPVTRTLPDEIEGIMGRRANGGPSKEVVGLFGGL